MIRQFSKKLNTPYNPTISFLGIQPREINDCVHLKNLLQRMFRAAYFIV